tara:strand:+ start:727 stop:1617 length:891 start_codon:yes stop_codon:yes gene_type:complete
MKELVIHLGYPKTATTFFQSEIFNKSRQINYLGKPFNNTFQKIEKIIMSSNEKDFKSQFPELLDLFSLMNLQDRKLNLISNEGFLLFRKHNNNFLTTLFRLKDICDELNINLKFFFVIRNQNELLISYFIQAEKYLKLHKITLKDILNSLTNNIHNEFLDFFNFYDIYLQIKKIDPDVRVFAYEEFREYPKVFINDICKYLKINNDFNVDYKLEINKTINKLSFINRLKFHVKNKSLFNNINLKINFFISNTIFRSTQRKRNQLLKKEKFIKKYFYKNNLLINKIMKDKLTKNNYF